MICILLLCIYSQSDMWAGGRLSAVSGVGSSPEHGLVELAVNFKKGLVTL